MIKNKKDYLFYLEADRIALSKPQKLGIVDRIKLIIFPDYVWIFEKLLRKVEYYKNCKKGILNKIRYFILIRKFRKLSLKLGFSIPANVFGLGLSISHYGTIIVNAGAKIGANSARTQAR